MTVRELAEKLSLKSINVDDDTREISGAYTGDLLSWVMGRAKQDNLWITIMSDFILIQYEPIEKSLSCSKKLSCVEEKNMNLQYQINRPLGKEDFRSSYLYFVLKFPDGN